ncbi:MAG: polyisoprenoid-binding protein [Phenylobacterium sp.]|uniref:YceI family protein n=1 Tax=Phenylobacterium sp. TaxID=1871053 RepID=UPI001217FCF4|nr:YceI family protein [Phenylobacterium sp.]TAJ72275.1 MAG: polyisoprenoid-binding protein [Phenylobacterium sp.]
MPRYAATALAISLLASGAAAADPTSRDPARVPAGSYDLDPRHAALLVKVPHMGGFSRYTMRFRVLSGAFAYDPANWQATKVTIAVDPKSIDTEDNVFNKTVAGYFEPEKYPVISFASTGLTTTEEGKGQLNGDLTLHGVTKPIVLDVEFNGVGPGLLGAGTRMGFSGTGRIKRSEFGVTGGRPFAGDTVDLAFEVEFVKK